ncbi:hypothetical protein KZZ52_12325 [Dactylosporangium sp. AC04546]|uniref:hypothetical protein n=1 Tax=Dactylosporangium sp. AC04546 TaxID=2862460 RepID=UPI001EE133CD|nr:hypothetical protein [Dactylosporangium sp. AC04546]WVK86126.1 hypothetical protein KZZ52_12325 [Dactylosporangium sp. AC04546]
MKLAMGWALLVAGSFGTLVTAWAGESLKPHWFDPDEACVDRFGPTSGSYTIETGYFPVRATCVSGGGARLELVDPGDTVIASSILAAMVLAVLAGLVLIALGWLRRPVGTSTVEPAAPFEGGKVATHAVLIWFIVLVFTGVMALLVACALFVAGPIAGAVLPLPVLVLGGVFAAIIDRTIGPGRAQGRASLRARHRGLLVGAGGLLASFALLTGVWMWSEGPDLVLLLTLPLLPAPAALTTVAQNAMLSVRV